MSELFPVGEDQAIEVQGDDLRTQINELEQKMFNSDCKIHIEPRHYFTDGVYAREITIPKGALVTGKIHKTEHLNIVSAGEISVLTEDGMKRIKAPFTMISKPGTKRVGFAHEDTVWTTVHGTQETDLETLEDLLIAKTHDEVEGITAEQIKQLQEAE